MDVLAIEAAVSDALARTAGRPEFKGMSPERIFEALVSHDLPRECLQPFLDIINSVMANDEGVPVTALETPQDLARLAGLTDLQLRVFRLNYGNNMNVNQIAARLHITKQEARREARNAWTAISTALYGKDAQPERQAMELLHRIALRMLRA